MKKKKFPLFLLVILVLVCLYACGYAGQSSSDTPSPTPAPTAAPSETPAFIHEADFYYGTWQFAKIEKNGMTADKEAIRQSAPELSDMFFILHEGGSCYMDGNIGTWMPSRTGINIGSSTLECEDDLLRWYIPDEDCTLCFEKISSEQEFPQSSETPTAVPAEEATPAPESNALRPEFKEAMDSYEAFFDKYVEIMASYENNPSDLTILTEYASYMAQYADMMDKLEAWDESEMNDAELAYYIDVTARIEKKLLSVA